MQDYRKLVVWQKAHKLVLDVYADSATYLRKPDAWAVRDQTAPGGHLHTLEYRRGGGPGDGPGLSSVSLSFVGVHQRT